MNDKIKFQKPKILQAFVSGFNTTANHIYLIILPILVDLFIWFGPRFSIQKFLTPTIRSLTSLPGFDAPQVEEIIQNFTTDLLLLASKFNLAIVIRTFPVGVPSLISSLSPTSNPVGTPVKLDIANFEYLFVFLTAFTLFGLIIGSFYFHQTASTILKDYNKRTFVDFLKLTLQIILFPILLLILILIVSIPISLLIPILSLISPFIGQIGLLIGSMLIIWIAIPLFFTPHSIFLFKQNLIASMMTSISVVRFSLPGSALFLIAALLLAEAMNMLWRVPPENSWMLMVGVFGHAFISTAILASSYHYFLDATQFTQSIINSQIKPAANSQL